MEIESTDNTCNDIEMESMDNACNDMEMESTDNTDGEDGKKL